MGKNMWVRAAAACCAISLPLALSACGDNELSPYLSQNLSEQQSALPANKPHLSGEFAGAGASSQKSAVDAWIVGFSASQPQTAISYDPSGSGAGVNTFLTGAVSYHLVPWQKFSLAPLLGGTILPLRRRIPVWQQNCPISPSLPSGDLINREQPRFFRTTSRKQPQLPGPLSLRKPGRIR